MKVAVFSAKKYDREFLNAANGARHELRFFEPHLNEETVGLATGFEAVCVFVNDQVNAAVIERLHSLGIRLIALRCAGYNNVDLAAAKKHGITVVRVPAYSPYAVAEHTDCSYVGAQPETASSLQSRPRRKFRPRRLARVRHARQNSRRDRHRTNRDRGGANSHRIRLSDFGIRSISKCDLSVSRRALRRAE